ncbi:2325_t:CDS:2 [Ambispora gerdemannii]|uniref:2325_t:CDS:1 n=1 Tax=Ambispora gerdemannii TaxID=144530 RepID=A0A9N9BRU3_9GLOM|nr:2325_t:CDS:2 [Ambispora gerdemannii]
MEKSNFLTVKQSAQQTNSSDCGVFVLANTEKLVGLAREYRADPNDFFTLTDHERAVITKKITKIRQKLYSESKRSPELTKFLKADTGQVPYGPQLSYLQQSLNPEFRQMIILISDNNLTKLGITNAAEAAELAEGIKLTAEDQAYINDCLGVETVKKFKENFLLLIDTLKSPLKQQKVVFGKFDAIDLSSPSAEPMKIPPSPTLDEVSETPDLLTTIAKKLTTYNISEAEFDAFFFNRYFERQKGKSEKITEKILEDDNLFTREALTKINEFRNNPTTSEAEKNGMKAFERGIWKLEFFYMAQEVVEKKDLNDLSDDEIFAYCHHLDLPPEIGRQIAENEEREDDGSSEAEILGPDEVVMTDREKAKEILAELEKMEEEKLEQESEEAVNKFLELASLIKFADGRPENPLATVKEKDLTPYLNADQLTKLNELREKINGELHQISAVNDFDSASETLFCQLVQTTEQAEKFLNPHELLKDYQTDEEIVKEQQAITTIEQELKRISWLLEGLAASFKSTDNFDANTVKLLEEIDKGKRELEFLAYEEREMITAPLYDEE